MQNSRDSCPCSIHSLPKRRQGNGANCAEFAWLYLTQNELRGIRAIRCSFCSLPGPEEGPLLVRIARNLRHSRMLSVNGVNCAEFVWLYLTRSELRETRMIHGSLGSLPGPEKVPLLVRIAQNLCHSRML